MHTYRKLFINLFALLVVLSAGVVARAQCPVMPAGFLCISQAAGNVAAETARELTATKAKVTVLESGLVEKDRLAGEVKAITDANEADLRRALHETEVKLATKTGELIGSEANNVRNLAVIDLLLKSVRPKKIGIINF